MTNLMLPKCGLCGTLLPHIDAACPNCLPNFYTRLRTPQGEPALTQPCELPGTREPVVTAPQGNAGESPARLLPSKERSARPFSLWSFLRNVLHQGESIGLDSRERPYEEYSARMDAAAREREEQLRKALGLTDETKAPYTLAEAWRAATTLAHNICTQESDRINADDGPPEAMHALGEAARRIRGWLEPAPEQLGELLAEHTGRSAQETSARKLTDAENEAMDRDIMEAIQRDEKATSDGPYELALKGYRREPNK